MMAVTRLLQAARLLLAEERTAIIRKEKGKWVVRSPNNPKWSGGAFDTKEEAVKRLQQCEGSKHRGGSVVTAKGVSLVPEYNKAVEALEVRGDMQPLVTFCKKTIAMLFPDGDNKVVAWYHGLGTAKRNAINTLQKNMRSFLVDAPQIPAGPSGAPSWVRGDEGAVVGRDG